MRGEDVERFSPRAFGHVNRLGGHAFSLPEAVARGELRSPRDPRRASDGEDE